MYACLLCVLFRLGEKSACRLLQGQRAAIHELETEALQQTGYHTNRQPLPLSRTPRRREKNPACCQQPLYKESCWKMRLLFTTKTKKPEKTFLYTHAVIVEMFQHGGTKTKTISTTEADREKGKPTVHGRGFVKWVRYQLLRGSGTAAVCRVVHTSAAFLGQMHRPDTSCPASAEKAPQQPQERYQ